MRTIVLNDTTVGITNNSNFLAVNHIEGSWYASEIHSPEQKDYRINVHVGDGKWSSALRQTQNKILYDGLINALKNFNSYQRIEVLVDSDNRIYEFKKIYKNPEIEQVKEPINLSYDNISNYGIF